VILRADLDPVERGIAVRGIVMEQHQLAGARLPGNVHRVLDRAVAPMAFRSVFLVRVLRVVDEHVDAVAQLEHLLRHVVVRVLGATARTVVGDVRDRDAVPVHTESERRTDVTHPARPNLRDTDREVVVARVVKTHVARELRGRDREVRRPHHCGEHVAERPVGLTRPVHVETRRLAVQRREERQPLHVVPVQVREQDRAVEVALAMQAVRAESGAEVEDDRVRALGLEGDTRGVSAVPGVGLTRAGRGSAYTVEADADPS
jgi:hypothetical protein